MMKVMPNKSPKEMEEMSAKIMDLLDEEDFNLPAQLTVLDAAHGATVDFLEKDLGAQVHRPMSSRE